MQLPDLDDKWVVGMKLEAVDKHNAGLVCVATVANVLAGRVLVHFDGWEIDYDYWVVPSTSPYLHPVGWCAAYGIELIPPKGVSGASATFSWQAYLAATRSQPVPTSAFRAAQQVRNETLFKTGWKLEVVDKRNQAHVRVGTVVKTAYRQVQVRT